ncbi:24449_t:CDS:2, partial [Gigaspora margarita]
TQRSEEIQALVEVIRIILGYIILDNNSPGLEVVKAFADTVKMNKYLK